MSKGERITLFLVGLGLALVCIRIMYVSWPDERTTAIWLVTMTIFGAATAIGAIMAPTKIQRP